MAPSCAGIAIIQSQGVGVDEKGRPRWTVKDLDGIVVEDENNSKSVISCGVKFRMMAVYRRSISPLLVSIILGIASKQTEVVRIERVEAADL